MERLEIRTVTQLIVGYIEIDSSGNKTAKDVTGRILGYYDRSRNATLSVYRQILAYGDLTALFFKDSFNF